jgi:hypothetical protein
MATKIQDPLAQSFYVENPAGIFATSIDLYFYSTDKELPVTVQLRPMKLGFPTPEIYPFSEVVLEPSKIRPSPDASIPTRVTFPSPVYLEGDKFHCLVLTSNSSEHTVWISHIGEVDARYLNATESKQVIVSSQPSTGSLFQSQNGQTWTPNQYEDLKFVLYRANFTSNDGNVNFYNPALALGNNQIARLSKNPFEVTSKKLRLDLNRIVTDPDIKVGNTILQQDSDAYGNLVGTSGQSNGNLTVINSGIGYTPSLGGLTYFDVPLTSVTGTGKNATANITIQDGVAVGATIVNGGNGYTIGDVVTADTIGDSALGRNLRLSISNISGINELIVDQVQGTFRVGVANTLQYVNNSGVRTDINYNTTRDVRISNIDIESDGLHIKVNHPNHGMHAPENLVKISDALPDLPSARLVSSYANNSTQNITLSDIALNPDNGFGIFSTFENIGISSTNPGYVKIGDEIISYDGVNGNALTGIIRGIDGTPSYQYPAGSVVFKYEMAGISLRRINKVHTLQDATVSKPIDLDYYHIRVDTNESGIDRNSSPESLPELHFKQTKSCGGPFVKATQNINFEIIRPVVQTMTLNGTSVNASIRTYSGRSVGGSETSFVDQGFDQLSLSETNYLKSPRIICSTINEQDRLPDNGIEGSKSFNMSINLSTTSPYISPVIDLDRASVILTTNRINRPIDDYASDERTASMKDDPHSFVYATKPITLETPATSIKIIVSAYVNIDSDLRAFYGISNNQGEEFIYYPFPGYSNISELGDVIDDSLSNGTPDTLVPKTDVFGFLSNELAFRDYEFTVNNLPSFRTFGIKLAGSSRNQTYPIRIRDLRVISLA